MFKILHKAKNQKGLTLIELIVVIALIGVFLAAVAVMVSKGRQASTEGDVIKKVDLVINGLGEYKMYKHNLPTTAGPTAISATALASYIPSELHTYQYRCEAGTANNAQIITPANTYENAAAATRHLDKLKDLGICDATSSIAGSVVTCVIKQFMGNSGC